MKQSPSSIRRVFQIIRECEERKEGKLLEKSVIKRLLKAELNMDFQKVIDDIEWLRKISLNQSFDVLRRYRLFCDVLVKALHHEEDERLVHKYGVTFRDGRIQVGEGLKKNGENHD